MPVGALPVPFYAAKESLVGFYRVRSYAEAARILTAITDGFARSDLPEIQTLRGTPLRWRREIRLFRNLNR